MSSLTYSLCIHVNFVFFVEIRYACEYQILIHLKRQKVIPLFSLFAKYNLILSCSLLLLAKPALTSLIEVGDLQDLKNSKMNNSLVVFHLSFLYWAADNWMLTRRKPTREGWQRWQCDERKKKKK